MGILRITLRDLFPALDGVGLYRLIVILDAHIPAHSFFQPEEAAAAIEHALIMLGPAEVERIRGRAQTMDFDEVLALLNPEIQTALASTASLGLKSDADGQN